MFSFPSNQKFILCELKCQIAYRVHAAAWEVGRRMHTPFPMTYSVRIKTWVTAHHKFPLGVEKVLNFSPGWQFFSCGAYKYQNCPCTASKLPLWGIETVANSSTLLYKCQFVPVEHAKCQNFPCWDNVFIYEIVKPRVGKFPEKQSTRKFPEISGNFLKFPETHF